MRWQAVIAEEARDCEEEEYAEQLLRLLPKDRLGLAAFSPSMGGVWITALGVAVTVFYLQSLPPRVIVSVAAGWTGISLAVCASLRWSTWARTIGRHKWARREKNSSPPAGFQPDRLEQALRRACGLRRPGWEQWRDLLRRLGEQRSTDVPADESLRMLSSESWEDRFLARHLLADLGGEVVPNLVDLVNNGKFVEAVSACRTLYAIGKNSEKLLAVSAVMPRCAEHLVRLSSHTVTTKLASWLKVKTTYLGCRVCGQNRHLVGPPVAVLDNQDQEERRQAGNELRVDWLVWGELFDFERVEIERATDQQVARFILALGNDADEARGPGYYRQKRCDVAETCDLSENTVRALRVLFDEVRVVPALDQAPVSESAATVSAKLVQDVADPDKHTRPATNRWETH